MIGVLCGLSAEADILKARPDLVFCGTNGAMRLGQALRHRVLTGLMSFGTCGALSPDLSVGDLVIGTIVLGPDGPKHSDAEWLGRLPATARMSRGPVLSLGDVSADTPQQRASLFKEYSALAIDEESGTVASLAGEYELPFMIVRAVSDDAHDAIPPAALIGTNPDGSTNFLNIVKSIGNDPAQIAALIRIASEFDKAIKSLTSYYESAAVAFAN